MYTLLPPALSVDCGAPPRRNHSIVGNKAVAARCRWNGTFSVPAECQNSDEGVGNLYGSHDVCQDKATPTGVHVDDYTCNRDPGFDSKSLKKDGRFTTCENVPACPDAQACLPKTCMERDYSCSCPPSYEERSSAGYKHGARTSPRSYSARRQANTWTSDEKGGLRATCTRQEIEGLSSHRTGATHEAERFLWAVAGG